MRAIKTALCSLGSNVNLGLMEFVTGGTANDDGGFIRQAIVPMTSTNITSFDTKLTTIYSNITSPNEKRNAGTGYGDLMFDAYNYFNGGSCVSPTAVIGSLADANGYRTTYTQFSSPLSDANACGQNFIIFIGNPDASGPSSDSSSNGPALTSLGGSISPQIQVPGFTTSSANVDATPALGYTSACYASAAVCSPTADYAALCPPTATTYDGCHCVSPTTTALPSCAAGTQRFLVSGTTNTLGTESAKTLVSTNTITNPTTPSSACYSSFAAANTAVTGGTDTGGLSLPANPATTQTGTNPIIKTYHTNSSPVYSLPSSTPNATVCHPSSQHAYNITQKYTQTVQTTSTPVTSSTTVLGDTTQCYATGSAATAEFTSCTNGTYNGGCSSGTADSNAGQCTSGARYTVSGFNLTTVVTATGTFAAPAKPTSGTANADEWARFMHQPKAINSASGTDTIKQSINTYTIDVFNAQQNSDETSLYMSMARVGGGKYFSAKNESQIVAALQSILTEIQSVNSTFASASLPVNATNRTQNANQVFIGMFRPDPDANPRWYGNLKQYAIGKVGADLDLVDVKGNPATNVLTGFIADCAISFWTTDSIWPTNSSKYWSNLTVNPDPASNCSTTTLASLGGAIYSDLPDGPTVEKGAVAEILRKGNNAAAATPTWSVNRNILTLSSATQANGALVAFDTTSTLVTSVLSSNLANFTRGVDIPNDTGLYNASTNPNQTRPSIHGDVVHSRPLPVNYGNGVTVYYGANDGSLRAVDSSDGQERWAFVAPEHFVTSTKLQRLLDNSPRLDYKIASTAGNPAKDYFFDGSIGIYQAAASGSNPPVWIYPTMRRGGRMVYGFDVSNPAAAAGPTLLWRHGCQPTASGADTCDSGYTQMGQTWSTPNVAFINGYSTDNQTKPVVVVGGGYDGCEDTNSNAPSCGSTTGNAIYFIDAQSGNLITSFTTDRAVAADVTLIDVNNDGLVDYAYAADTGGNIYRIDFVNSPDPKLITALPHPTTTNNKTDATHWFMHKVAYTNGNGRKFLFGPGLFPTGTSAYLAVVSGDREHPLSTDYPYTTPVTNRAYVYKDSLASTFNTAAVNLDDPTQMLNVTDATTSTCTSTNLLSSTSSSGWFMDLTANGVGEQGVTSAVIVGGMVTFSTNRPITSTMSCGNRLGEARGYFVNLFNGSGSIGTAGNASCGGVRSATFAGGGLPPSPVIGIVPINGVPTAVLIGAVDRTGAASSPIKPSKITPPINQTRRRTYKYIKGDD